MRPSIGRPAQCTFRRGTWRLRWRSNRRLCSSLGLHHRRLGASLPSKRGRHSRAGRLGWMGNPSYRNPPCGNGCRSHRFLRYGNRPPSCRTFRFQSVGWRCPEHSGSKNRNGSPTGTAWRCCIANRHTGCRCSRRGRGNRRHRRKPVCFGCRGKWGIRREPRQPHRRDRLKELASWRVS